jgi:hypothetical protein
MKAHRWTQYVARHARTVPDESLAEAPRADSLARTARGMVIMSLVIGGLGAGAAASSGHASADHVNGHQQTGNIRLMVLKTANRPWIY